MSHDIHPLHSTLVNLLPTAARTATANGTGVDVTDYEGMAEVVLDSAAGAGTSPTQDIKLQDSADNSTYADIAGATFTQVVNAASQQKISVDLSSARKYVRAVSTIGGTSPSFTSSVNLLARKKYLK